MIAYFEGIVKNDDLVINKLKKIEQVWVLFNYLDELKKFNLLYANRRLYGIK